MDMTGLYDGSMLGRAKKGNRGSNGNCPDLT